MAQDKSKQVSQITDMDADFAQWYTDVCTKAELSDNTSVKGMFICRCLSPSPCSRRRRTMWRALPPSAPG